MSRVSHVIAISRDSQHYHQVFIHMASGTLRPKRSFTGHHTLLPASREGALYKELLNHQSPRYTIISWTFGRGSVVSALFDLTQVPVSYRGYLGTRFGEYGQRSCSIRPLLLVIPAYAFWSII